MDGLKKQAEDMIKNVKSAEKEIDNPVLTMSVLSELYFLIDHLEGE